MWLALFVFLLGYLAYLECHPGYGAIWCRPDDLKTRRVAWGTINMLLWEPFCKRMWWQPFYWDMNLWIWLASALVWDYVIQQVVHVM